MASSRCVAAWSLLACVGVALLLGAPAAGAGPGRRCDAVKAGQPYTTRYDNVDVDAILTSARLLRAYVDCLMERGPCTKEGCFLKAVIPDALKSECSLCNDKQKVLAGKMLAFMLQYHRHDHWKDLIDKYDPTGEFRRKHNWEDDADEDEEEEEENQQA